MSDSQKQKVSGASKQRQTPRQAGRVAQAPMAQMEEPDWLALQHALEDPSVVTRAGIVALQETAGNRAVQRFVGRRPGSADSYLDGGTAPVQRKDGDQDRIAVFKRAHPGHDHVLAGFSDEMSETEVVGKLLENFFERTDFDYNFSARSGFGHNGDCGTLVNEFITIARECFQIEMTSHKEDAGYFVPSNQRIVHKEERRGNIDGRHWYFENHVWAIWQGKPIDVLFGQFGVVSHMAGVKGVYKDGSVKYEAGDFVFFAKQGATSEFDRYTSDPRQKLILRG